MWVWVKGAPAQSWAACRISSVRGAVDGFQLAAFTRSPEQLPASNRTVRRATQKSALSPGMPTDIVSRDVNGCGNRGIRRGPMFAPENVLGQDADAIRCRCLRELFSIRRSPPGGLRNHLSVPSVARRAQNAQSTATTSTTSVLSRSSGYARPATRGATGADGFQLKRRHGRMGKRHLEIGDLQRLINPYGPGRLAANLLLAVSRCADVVGSAVGSTFYDRAIAVTFRGPVRDDSAVADRVGCQRPGRPLVRGATWALGRPAWPGVAKPQDAGEVAPLRRQFGGSGEGRTSRGRCLNYRKAEHERR